MSNIVEKRAYRHYKGEKYFVLCIGEHTETGEKFVVYHLWNPWKLNPKIWIRPLSVFTEMVDGVKRFER